MNLDCFEKIVRKHWLQKCYASNYLKTTPDDARCPFAVFFFLIEILVVNILAAKSSHRYKSKIEHNAACSEARTNFRLVIVPTLLR